MKSRFLQPIFVVAILFVTTIPIIYSQDYSKGGLGDIKLNTQSENPCPNPGSGNECITGEVDDPDHVHLWRPIWITTRNCDFDPSISLSPARTVFALGEEITATFDLGENPGISSSTQMKCINSLTKPHNGSYVCPAINHTPSPDKTHTLSSPSFTWSADNCGGPFGGPGTYASFTPTVPTDVGLLSFTPDSQATCSEADCTPEHIETTAESFYVIKVELPEIDRVPPTKTKQVQITTDPSPLPSGCSISLVCETDQGTVGSATVTPASITQTTTVTITGGTQSWGSGNTAAPDNIKLRAKLGSTVCDEEAFTVCAHPCNFKTSRYGDIDGISVGVYAKNEWESDSGVRSHMDKAQRRERVEVHSRDNPPFTVGGAGLTSGYIDATVAYTVDEHSYPKSWISLTAAGHVIYKQLFQFKCTRCGKTNNVCNNSGFHIDHHVWQDGTQWKHKCTKSGSSVSIDGESTGAGSGTATSDVHLLP